MNEEKDIIEEKNIIVEDVDVDQLDLITGGSGYEVEEETVIGGDNNIKNQADIRTTIPKAKEVLVMMQIGKKIANENLKNVAGGMDSCTDSGFIFSDSNLDDRSSDYEEKLWSF